MIRWKNGRILAASASLLLVTTSCAEPEASPEVDADPAAAEVEADVGTMDAEPAAADDGVLLDPNDAESAALMGAGLSQELVDAIVEARPIAGMADLDALLAASLDGPAREDLYERVWIPLDLNTASREEILLIPGVGERMAHEFEEYRPYRAIEQFRREMGKYVDEDEVARLERYVVIR